MSPPSEVIKTLLLLLLLLLLCLQHLPLLLHLQQGKGREKEEPLCGMAKGGKVIAGFAAVGAMTSLPFMYSLYTHVTTDRRTERPIS